ncbi:MAG TPA: ABC transporter permease [Terracidiphilus sp.]|nr:ABC transporter permease [Terracidiphilus sp.]
MAWKKPGTPIEDPEEREIAFHIEEMTAANIARGRDPVEARRLAMIEFGGREQVRQQLREVHLAAWREHAWFLMLAAVRFLRKSPGFSLAVIVTLALGIGANSAVFSAIDAIVLRPLAFPHGDELVRIYQHDIQGRNANTFVAPQRLEDWNRMTATFSGITGYYKDDLSEISGSLPEKMTEALVAPRFLDVLGVSPALGRNFTAEEERFGGPDAVLISYAFWQRRFHGDPNALNRKLHIGKYYFSIVGIMPEGFQFPDRDVDMWEVSAPDAPVAQGREETWFTVIGRMKPGVTLQQAAADLATVQSRLGKQFPHPDAELRTEIVPLKATVIGSIGSSLWLLYGSVSLLLLIACSNIAALLLARTTQREYEISIRYSLGASRGSIIGQLLAEVMGLALLGGLAGLVVAACAARGFQMLAATLPRAGEVRLNWSVAVYSLACAVLTAGLCGLYPALRATRRELAHGLAAGGRTQAAVRSPMQWTLVGVQVTLAVTLLVGAGLLLRSLDELGHVAPGFDPGHVLTFQVSGSWGETTDMAGVVSRVNRTLNGLRALPGVENAATTIMLPGVPDQYQMELKIDGKLDPGRKILAEERIVSAGYFGAVKIPMLAGEGCRESSTTDVMVNRSFANLYLGAGAAGHTLEDASGNAFGLKGTVRGVVGDAREEGLNESPAPTVYFCYSAPNPFPNYVIGTHGDPMAMADAVRRRIHELEPARSVYDMMPLEQHLSDAFMENRLRTMMLTLFAVTAVALACTGLYGTLSYLGRLRQREVGVRLALGATRGQIAARFLVQGLRVVGLGCAAGLVLAVAMSRILRGMLFGVSNLDPATYAGVVAVILAVAALASLAPALRAAWVEPVRVLREE